MQPIQDDIWGSLSFSDYRQRFFIESFRELLSQYTPHFYQARLMNLLSSSEEIIEAIDVYLKTEYKSELLNASLEMNEVLNSDPIAEKLFRGEIVILKELLNGLNNSPANLGLKKIATICQKFINRRDEYHLEVVAELRRLLFGAVDLSKKARLLEDIHKITSIYVCNLLNSGYSPTYLYNRMAPLLKSDSYNGKSFNQLFEALVNKLDNRQRLFKVYFAIKTNKLETILANEHLNDVVFTSDIDVKDEKMAKWTFGTGRKIYAYVEVTAPDHVSAAWNAKKELDCCLDYIYTKSPKMIVEPQKNCMVIFKVSGCLYKEKVNIDLLVRFLSHDEQTDLNNTHSHKKVGQVLAKDSYKHLSRSFRYLRLGRESVSLEQKLLNTWIALESLFVDFEGNSIIEPIVDFVPKAYAHESIISRSAYVLELLVKHECKVTEKLALQIPTESGRFENSIALEEFYNAFTNKEAVVELFDSLGDKEHLKFRLKVVYDELKASNNIRHRIEKTKNDVERQLKRLYSYRNKIAHTGYMAGVRPQLINHLVEYLMVSYKAIFTSISSAESIENMTIDQALISFLLGIECKEKTLYGPAYACQYSDLVVNPII